MAPKTKSLNLDHFDTQSRYDIYFEAARRMMSLRNVRILGLKTWEEFDDPEDATNTFLAVQNSDGHAIFIETEAVTLLAQAGTSVLLD